ncbi:PP2C family protein-serine/threonine phosphatase [Streptomyces sp. SID3343]|uniref:PP2C family protein-serine/threonine phosphatase n=1 Tax=Streptomyces sp. SID3343 TaxID=2690260 RepID=UPI001369E50F|nr:PP2C family protein-serine/threonine phosphatase [Streptomyces sp. SID3343]MYV99114.1 SpoIIE family protein phosphatase [Streptomyces sp. SID3343]
MRERPERPVDGPVVDPTQWLAHIRRMRAELDGLRGGSATAATTVAGDDAAAAAAHRRALLCDLLACSLSRTADYLAGLSLAAGDEEHHQADDPGPATSTPARSAVRPPDVGPMAPFPVSAGDDGVLPWRHLRRLFVEPPDRESLLPDQRGTSWAGSGADGFAGGAGGSGDGDGDGGVGSGWDSASGRDAGSGGASGSGEDSVCTSASAAVGASEAAAASAATSGSARAGCGLVASAEWHLDGGNARWSAEMYELFGRDPRLGPLPLDELPAHVADEDRSFVDELVRDLVEHANGAEGEFRIVRGDGSGVHVQFVGEPVLDADGVPHSVWVLLRDLTQLRRTQVALTRTRAQLLAQRQLVRSEHRVAAELQRVVMPWWTRPASLPGLEVATRYFPAEQASKVGGDWYDALALPGGDVLLAVGDMSGHGLVAASGMTTLRGALQGVAMTGAGPAEVLRALNRIVVHTLPADKVATAVCARFDPATRVLTWAQGGHPPPLLYRDGVGSALTAPFGMLLGAIDDPEFVEAHTELLAEDVLLVFTDGLVERRGRGTEEAVRALLDVGPQLLGSDARTCVDVVLSRLGHTRYEDDACVMAVCVR